MMDMVTVHGPCHVMTGQKRSRKLKLSNFRWFQSEALKQANRQRNKFRKYVMGEKRHHFASQQDDLLYLTSLGQVCSMSRAR